MIVWNRIITYAKKSQVDDFYCRNREHSWSKYQQHIFF